MYGSLGEDPFFYTTIVFSVLSVLSFCLCIIQFFFLVSFITIFCFCNKRRTNLIPVLEENVDDEQDPVESKEEISSLLSVDSIRSDGFSSIDTKIEEDIEVKVNYFNQRKNEQLRSGEKIKSLLSTLHLGEYVDTFEENEISLDELIDLDGDKISLQNLIPDENDREYFSHFLSDSVQKIEYKESTEESNMRTIDVLEVLNEEAKKHSVSSPYSPSTRTSLEINRLKKEKDLKNRIRTRYVEEKLKKREQIDKVMNSADENGDFNVIYPILKKLNLEMYSKKFTDISLEDFLDLEGGEEGDLASLVPSLDGRARLSNFIELSLERLEEETGEDSFVSMGTTELSDLLFQVTSRVMRDEKGVEDMKRLNSQEGLSTPSLSLDITEKPSSFPVNERMDKQRRDSRKKESGTEKDRIRFDSNDVLDILQFNEDDVTTEGNQQQQKEEVNDNNFYYRTKVDRDLNPFDSLSPNSLDSEGSLKNKGRKSPDFIILGKYKNGSTSTKENRKRNVDEEKVVFVPSAPSRISSNIPLMISPTTPPKENAKIPSSLSSPSSSSSSSSTTTTNTDSKYSMEQMNQLFPSSISSVEEGEEGYEKEMVQYCPIPQKNTFNEGYIVKCGPIISKGSFGQVRLIYLDLGGSELVKAVEKVIPFSRGNTKEKIQNEVKIMKMLKHPNLLNCFGSYASQSCENIVLEYCPNGDLYKAKKLMSVRQRLKAVWEIVQGMKFLHSKGIVHRDLKSKNVLVCSSGVCKIGDFGSSVNLGSLDSAIVGTVEYLAPEVLDSSLLPTFTSSTNGDNKNSKQQQQQQQQALSHEEEEEEEAKRKNYYELYKRMDIYSFGIILWELFSLSQPYLDLRRKLRNNQFEMLNIIHKKKLRPDLSLVKDYGLKEIFYLKRLTVKCWSHFPLDRPESFEVIEKELIENGMGQD